MLKNILVAGAALPLLFACAKKNNTEQAQTTPQSSTAIVFDSTQAKELSGQDRIIKSISLNLKAGEKYSYKNMELITEKSDTVEIVSRKERFYTKKIKSIRSDGSIELTVVFDSIKVFQSAKTPNMNKEDRYNSNLESDRNKEEYKSFTSLVGEEFSAIIDKSGSIVEMSGLSPVVTKVLGTKKDSVAPQMKEQLIMSIKNQLAGILTLEYLEFPNKELDSTQSWTYNTKIPLSPFMYVDAKKDFKIESVKNFDNKKFATINQNVTGNFVLDPKAKSAFKIDKKNFTVSTTQLINAETGMTVKKTINTILEIGGTVQNRKISQFTNSVASYELLK